MTAVFDPLHLGAVSLDVLAGGHANAAALAARQKSRLSALLTAAVRGSALYRERLQRVVPATVALSALPVLSRAELMGRFDDWVTDPMLKLAELQDFVKDPLRMGESYLGKYLVWESSGTSHQSGVFVQDAKTMAVFDALEALRRSAPRPLQRWLDPLLLSERVAFVGATTGHFASAVTMQRLRQLNPWLANSMRSFSIAQPTAALVGELNAFTPTVLATYPSVAALLADEAARGTLQSTPKEVWTGGETLSAAVRKKIESALGCTVRNSYGASEFMSIGWECSQGHMHVNADWVILEPVDAQGRPTPAGALSHTTLLTNLANHVQPLIRYDMGDQIAMHHGACACGASLPRIEVQGRCDDALVMAGTQGRSVTLLPLALTTVLEDDAGVFDFQLCQQDERTLVLKLELRGHEGDLAMARCLSALQGYAKSQGVASLRVVAELGQTIGRGRSGKSRRVVASSPVKTPFKRHRH
jgi:phenylacetate-coenzyme A ligase PaaK-like adenylate-forming protein